MTGGAGLFGHVLLAMLAAPPAGREAAGERRIGVGVGLL